MKIRILKVKGNSMHPTLKSGAFVLLCQSLKGDKRRFIPIVNRWVSIQVGDIVAVKHPQYGDIIKRVTALDYVNNNQEAKPILSHPLHFCIHAFTKHYKQISRLRLKGDNQLASVSEVDMGWIDAEQLIGKVIFVIDRK